MNVRSGSVPACRTSRYLPDTLPGSSRPARPFCCLDHDPYHGRRRLAAPSIAPATRCASRNGFGSLPLIEEFVLKTTAFICVLPLPAIEWRSVSGDLWDRRAAPPRSRKPFRLGRTGSRRECRADTLRGVARAAEDVALRAHGQGLKDRHIRARAPREAANWGCPSAHARGQ